MDDLKARSVVPVSKFKKIELLSSIAKTRFFWIFFNSLSFIT